MDGMNFFHFRTSTRPLWTQ